MTPNVLGNFWFIHNMAPNQWVQSQWIKIPDFFFSVTSNHYLSPTIANLISNFSHVLQHGAPTCLRHKPRPEKHFDFFFLSVTFLSILFFLNTRNSTLIFFFSPFLHTLKIFLRTLRFFFLFSQKYFDFFSINTPTLDIFFLLQKKLSECSSANNRQVLVKHRK